MVTVTLLGTAQDGGVPQVGCDCCIDVKQRFPVSIGLTDSEGGKHLFEATRYLGEQLRIWNVKKINSLFLTHAHFGHVDGLGLFGRETMNAQGNIAVLLREDGRPNREDTKLVDLIVTGSFPTQHCKASKSPWC